MDTTFWTSHVHSVTIDLMRCASPVFWKGSRHCIVVFEVKRLIGSVLASTLSTPWSIWDIKNGARHDLRSTGPIMRGSSGDISEPIQKNFICLQDVKRFISSFAKKYWTTMAVLLQSSDPSITSTL